MASQTVRCDRATKHTLEVHPLGSPYLLDFDLVTNIIPVINYCRRLLGLKRQKRNLEGSLERSEYKLLVNKDYASNERSQNSPYCL